jgi:hypothetical protein
MLERSSLATGRFRDGSDIVSGRNVSVTQSKRQSSAMAGKSKPGKIHLRIIEVMKRFPDGISGGQIRHELEKEGLEPGEQTHLDRRKRDLKKWFAIKKDLATIVVNSKSRKVTLYKYAGVRRKVVDEGQISLKERVEVIHGAHSRCQIYGNRLRRAFFLSAKSDPGELAELCFIQTRADHLRFVHPAAFQPSKKRADLGLCESLAVRIKFCEEVRQRLLEVGKDAFKFREHTAEATDAGQVFP